VVLVISHSSQFHYVAVIDCSQFKCMVLDCSQLKGMALESPPIA